MATDPYLIGGQIPFGQGGNPLAGAQGGLNGLAQQYGQGYQNALAMNEAQYGNILQGYQQTLGNQVNAQQALQGGYTGLYNNVMGTIQGIGASQSQNIQDVYAQQQGQMQNSMINRGLGNTTVMDSAQRGLTADQTKAQTALANQMAQLTAGYQSNLGLAGLNYGNQANMQNSAQANQQLGWMNSIQAPYPNAAQYTGLYQQQGQWQQAQADRALTQQLGTQHYGVGGVSGGGAGARGSGSVGSGGGNFGLYSHPMLPDTSMSYGGFSPGLQGGNPQGGLASGYTQLPQPNPEQYPRQFTGLGASQGADQGTGEGGDQANPNLWGSYGDLSQYTGGGTAEDYSFSGY